MDVKRALDSARAVEGAAFGAEDAPRKQGPMRNRGKMGAMMPKVSQEPMRIYPGADTNENVGYNLDSMAETIMRHDPMYDQHKQSIKAKLQKAVSAVCNGEE